MIIYHSGISDLDSKDAIVANIPSRVGFDILLTVSKIPPPNNCAAIQSHLNRGAIMIRYDDDPMAHGLEEVDLEPSYYETFQQMSYFDAEPRQKILMLGGDTLDERRSLYSDPMREWITLGGVSFFVYGDLYSELLQWEKRLIRPELGFERLIATLPGIDMKLAKRLVDGYGVAILNLLTMSASRDRAAILALPVLNELDEVAIDRIRLWMGMDGPEELFVINGDTHKKMEDLAEELGGKVKVG